MRPGSLGSRPFHVAHLRNRHPRLEPAVCLSSGHVGPRLIVGRIYSGFAEPWRAPRQIPRHDRAALHRHAGWRDGAAAAMRPRERSLGPLLRVRGRPHRAMRGGGVRAWHAGVRTGRARPTSIPARSESKSSIPATTSAIGIFRSRQMEAVIALCRDIVARQSIRGRPHACAFRRCAARANGPRREISLGSSTPPGRTLGEPGTR